MPGSGRMRHAHQDQVHQIIQTHQTALIIDRPQRQRYSPPQPSHQRAEISRSVGAIHKRRANHDQLHAGIRGHFAQSQLGFVFRHGIGRMRRHRILCGKRLPAAFIAIDPDRTDKHKPAHARPSRASRQIHRPVNVYLAKLMQGIAGAFADHMHPAGQVHDNIGFDQCFTPVRSTVNAGNNFIPYASDGAFFYANRSDHCDPTPCRLGTQGPADKTIRSRYQNFHIIRKFS